MTIENTAKETPVFVHDAITESDLNQQTDADSNGVDVIQDGEEITIEIDIDDADDMDAAKEEMIQALQDFIDESGGQVELMIDYVIGITETRANIAKAETIEDFEHAFMESIIMPLAKASASLPNPNLTISTLMSFGDAMMTTELSHIRELGIAKVDISQADFNRMRRYFMKVCQNGIGVEGVDAALRDVARYHEQKASDTLPDIPQTKFGFFKRLKMMKGCAQKQMDMLRNLVKQSHNLHDIEIWYSRYMLSAPIEYAKEHGYLIPAQAAAMATDEQVKKDCAQLAQSMGYDCDSADVDYQRVAHAMRTFCVNKTGYSYVENWLFAATSKHEDLQGSLLQ